MKHKYATAYYIPILLDISTHWECSAYNNIAPPEYIDIWNLAMHCLSFSAQAAGEF